LQGGADSTEEPWKTKAKATPALLSSSISTNPAAAGTSSMLPSNRLTGSSDAAAAGSTFGQLRGRSSRSHLRSTLMGPTGAGKTGLLRMSGSSSIHPAAMPNAIHMAALQAGLSSNGCLPSGTPALGPMPGQLSTMPGLAHWQGGSSQPVQGSSVGLPSKPAAPGSRSASYQQIGDEVQLGAEQIVHHLAVSGHHLPGKVYVYLFKGLEHGEEYTVWRSQDDCEDRRDVIAEYWGRMLTAPASSNPAVAGTTLGLASSPGVPQGSSIDAVPGGVRAGLSSSGCLPSGPPTLGPMPGLPGLAEAGSSNPLPAGRAGLASTPAAAKSPDHSDEEEEDTGEFAVEEILAHKEEGGKMFYRVKWLNYGAKHNIWVSAKACENCADLVNEYLERIFAANAGAGQ
jgi:hypothetical protein